MLTMRSVKQQCKEEYFNIRLYSTYSTISLFTKLRNQNVNYT